MTMQAPVYNTAGTKQTDITLPETVFATPWNPDLVHQVVTAYATRQRTNTAEAKDRKERRGGGRKPWPQKGLGRARHGSVRSPIWRGGGVTFGPRTQRDQRPRITKNMRNRALYTALAEKFRRGSLFFVDSLDGVIAKTAQARGVLEALAGAVSIPELATRYTNNALIVTPEYAPEVLRGFRNIAGVAVEEARNITAHDVLRYRYVVIAAPNESLERITERLNRPQRSTAEA